MRAFSAATTLLGLACWCAAAPMPADDASPLRPWTEYRAILWVGDSARQHPEKFPRFLEQLRALGIDTAMVYGAEGSAQPYLEAGFPYYVENIVNRGLCLKWNSSVTDWDTFVTAWAKEGRAPTAFVRDYCLDDPQWLEWAREQMRAAARRHGPHAPLAYDIRDELSVTVSANPFDFDFGPAALAGFRAWLRTRYRDLDHLNSMWATPFASWDDVRPFSTDQIKARIASGEAMPKGGPDWYALQRLRFSDQFARNELVRWNLAPWCDFRTYMDVSLARTLGTLRQAAREIDPRTPVGIEGTQMPHAFGGYDLARLARAVDWIEPYDIGNAREILGAFMPGRPILSTVFEKESNPARRRLWHLLLEGDRGCIIWWSEDCLDWSSPDLALTPKGKALAPVVRELKSPLARLFLRAERIRDPIYLHYSQPSIQVNWLLESMADGSTWHRRFSSFEAGHNAQAAVRNGWLKALQDLGWSPQFVSSDQLEQLALPPSAPYTLVLPASWALSDREVAAIQSVLESHASPTGSAQRRLVLWNLTPGLFDEHGRLLATNRLERLSPKSTAGLAPRARHAQDAAEHSAWVDVEGFPKERLKPNPKPAFWTWLRDQVSDGPIQLPPEARARVHRFKAGTAQLVGIERNIEYQMSEDLKQAGGNEALEQPVELTARLAPSAPPAHVYDLRAGTYLGHVRAWTFVLDPWHPSLFALLPEPKPADQVLDHLLGAVR